MQCVFFFFFFFLHDAATFFLQHEKEITGEASEKKIPISVLNCAIKRHEAEQEGGGERGFGFFFFFFFVMFCLHRFIHAAVFRHDSYSRFWLVF